MADNDLQLGRELAHIFMPYAMKRYDVVVREHRRFVHYTSAENAIKIIRSKQIWMRNTNCMADYMEVRQGFQHLKQFFDDQARLKLFQDALDLCANGVGREAIDLFNQWWNDILLNTYITSLSEHDDAEDQIGRLSMWRAFGRLPARAALVMNVPPEGSAAGLNVLLSPVAYFSYEEVQQQVLAIIENVKSKVTYLKSINRQLLLNSVFNMLLVAVVSLKHKGFEEEKEWRVVYSPNRRPSKSILKASEIVDGTPQIVHKIRLEDDLAENVSHISIPTLINRVIVGPSTYPGPIYQAFVDALQEAGVSDATARVFVSNIPLRT